jgi:hypothetical protein
VGVGPHERVRNAIQRGGCKALLVVQTAGQGTRPASDATSPPLRHLFSIGVWLALAAPALSQEPPAATSRDAVAGSADAGPQLLFGIEPRRDRFTYHFTNPSSFDTSALVPHFFEQRYVADNLWADATLRYLAHVRWETFVGVTPRRLATGDDYDTFFAPGGSVVVSGTTGGVLIRSFEVGQRAAVGRAGPIRFFASYRFRLDRSDFELGHKTVTRNGSLVDATDVTTREMTSSQTHEILFAATASRDLGSGWHVSIGGELAPTTLARLLVQLPDKYPGRDLVFIAKVLTGGARLAVTRRGRWPIEVSLEGGHAWHYRSSDWMSRDSIGARFAVGRSWARP